MSSISLSPTLRVSGASLPDAQHASAKTGATTSAINSPLLFDRFNKIDPEEKHFILDIAQANNDSLHFFENFHCKLYLNNGINEVNHFRTTNTDDTDEAEARWQNRLHALMGVDQLKQREINLVLLWDLVNYLTPAEARKLIEVLLPYCAKDALIHLYIFTSETMGTRPNNYRISRDNKVLYPPGTGELKTACPGYNLKQLQSMLEPFQMEHSVMLSSGIHEYLFQLS